MVTLELAEEFLARKWDVEVYTHLLDLPISAEFERLSASASVRVFDDPEDFVPGQYDLVWIHHSVLPPSLIERLTEDSGRTRVVWHHMAALPNIEAALFPDIEAAIADRISSVSSRTRDLLIEYGLPDDRSFILPNPVPRTFLEPAKTRPGTDLQTILIISNHPPDELLEAAELIRLQGIAVRRIGGSTPERVTPDSFEGVDAVVTIGKSVQYALCLGIPVYNYDHFGGNGWIEETNFEQERISNFSGRSTFRQISAEQITEEVRSGFSQAREFAQARIDRHRDAFGVVGHLDQLLGSLEADTGANTTSLSTAQALRWKTHLHLQRQNTRGLYWERNQRLALEAALEDLRARCRNLEEENTTLREQNDALQERLLSLEHSRALRVGQAALRPLRWARRMIQDRKE